MQIKRLTLLGLCCTSLLAATAGAAEHTLCPADLASNSFACESGKEQAWIKIKSNGHWKAKWHKGPVADLGDPSATTSYDLCIYADNTLFLEDRAAAGDEWRVAERADAETGPYKIKYRSDEGSIRKMMVKSPKNGKGKIKAKGRIPEGAVFPLGVVDGLVVQYLQVESGDTDEVTQCWESTFTVDNVKHDSENKFQARSKKAKKPK